MSAVPQRVADDQLRAAGDFLALVEQSAGPARRLTTPRCRAAANPQGCRSVPDRLVTCSWRPAGTRPGAGRLALIARLLDRRARTPSGLPGRTPARARLRRRQRHLRGAARGGGRRGHRRRHQRRRAGHAGAGAPRRRGSAELVHAAAGRRRGARRPARPSAASTSCSPTASSRWSTTSTAAFAGIAAAVRPGGLLSVLVVQPGRRR